MKYKSQVIEGKKMGRSIGFPTLNLDTSLFSGKKEGVYLVRVTTDNNQMFFGLLYFGPRNVLNESERILEIYLLDENKNIETRTLTFSLISYIRPVIPFASLEEAKKRQNEDVQETKRLIKNYKTKSQMK